MICVFGLEVSNKDNMLLDCEFGVFVSFAVNTNSAFCSRYHGCNCLVSTIGGVCLRMYGCNWLI